LRKTQVVDQRNRTRLVRTKLITDGQSSLLACLISSWHLQESSLLNFVYR